MKYFLTETERKQSKSTCYHEFYKGDWNIDNCEHWNSTSMNIHDDLMLSSNFYTVIQSIVPNYAYFGITKINRSQWEQIKAKSKETGEAAYQIVCEIEPWVCDTFKEHNAFTILGI